MRLSLYSPGITAESATRTIAGTIVSYGVLGYTSAGPLRVRAGALSIPTDPTRVKLTDEHDRFTVTGYLSHVEDGPDQLAGAFKVARGPLGDVALSAAEDKTKDGLSIDVDQAVIEGDELISARLVAVGQVSFPAFDDSRVSSVAAAAQDAPNGGQMDPTTTAAAQATATSSTPAPAAAPAPAPAPQPAPTVAASLAAVPAGVPAPSSDGQAPARTGQTSQLDAFCRTVTAALAPGGGGAAAITAALADVTSTEHTANIEAPGWSGELWSGVQYEPIFTPLLASGPLTNWEGRGWRWVVKPSMQDYAGDKAAIPTDTPTTEDASYEAARMAVGHDIDRKFYDFPNEAFLRGYVEAVRESWAMKLDGKVETYITTNAVALTGPDGPDAGTAPDPVIETSLFRAVGRGVLGLRRARVGRPTFVVVNDLDWFDLIDVTNDKLPALLDMYGINPNAFVSSPNVAQGEVLLGVKQAATVRTLPGSPIRVDAQHLANGGIDNAFFGYWAIEQHHTSGIMSVSFA